MAVRSPSIAPTLDVVHQVRPLAPDWDQDLRSLGGAVFHTSAWSEYRSHQGAHPLFLRWVDHLSGDVVAMALGTQHPPPTTRMGRLASYVLIESPPAARDALDLVAPLRRWGLRHGGSVAEIQLGSLDCRTDWAPADGALAVRQHEFLFAPCDPGDVLAAMSRGTRSHVRRAQRLGVRTRAASSARDLLEFARLGAATKQRLTHTKGLAPSVASPEGRARALELLVRRDAGRLYLACVDEVPVAGGFFAIWEGTAYYLENGADPAAHRCDAVHLMLHDAITDFMAAGFTRVNLGGVPAEGEDPRSTDHGLYNFKLRLGAKPVRCAGGSLVLRPARARALVIARTQRDRLRWIRRRVPAPRRKRLAGAP
jgi:hypothetical protein